MTVDKDTDQGQDSGLENGVAGEKDLAQVTPLISAKDIAEFLRKNTGFFDEHPALLADLSIPHTHGGAVSLIEKQVAVLREQNQQTSKQLHELIEIARQNEELARKMHQLGLTLMDATDPKDIFATLYDNLSKNFHADCVAVRIFGDPAFIDSFAGEEFAGKDTREVSLFKTMIESRQAMCGRMKHQQQAFLFGNEADEITSSVMVPLSGPNWSGIMAIGSFNPDRFEPGMGVELLANMAEVLSFILKPWIAET
jgi:uncharacterized protein YigA (DUF484 family)